jgi:hypothetical protein
MTEPRVIHVTPAQVMAAQLLVKRLEETSSPVHDAIRAIANAEIVGYNPDDITPPNPIPEEGNHDSHRG